MRHFDHQSGEYLDIDGAKVYCEVAGNNNGPVLLFLHGGFGNIEDFNGILPGLDKEFNVIGIDSRGHGKSTPGTGALTYERIQNDVEQVLKQLNIDTVSIVGFSDGGIVAYRLAALTSLNIEKMVTIGARWHLKNTEPIRGMISSVNGEIMKKQIPEMYNAYQRLNPEPDFAALVQALARMWLDPGLSGYPNEAVKNIDNPLLIVRGEKDPFVSQEAVIELSTAVRNAKLLNIPSAGHVAFEDQKEIFMSSLNKFLNSPDSQALEIKSKGQG